MSMPKARPFACNARPPEGHPFHGTQVACHLATGHLDLDEPHSWDIEAMQENHERLLAAMEQLRERFPDRAIERIDAQPAYPMIARDIDAEGQPGPAYRAYELPSGPWVCVTFIGGEEWAIWKATGAFWPVKDGAIVEDES